MSKKIKRGLFFSFLGHQLKVVSIVNSNWKEKKRVHMCCASHCCVTPYHIDITCEYDDALKLINLEKSKNIENCTIDEIFRIQFKNQKEDQWVFTNFDHFGFPNGFEASGRCWQETGVYGTYDEDVALKGLTWIAKRNPGITFRLIKITVSKKVEEIAEMTFGGKK